MIKKVSSEELTKLAQKTINSSNVALEKGTSPLDLLKTTSETARELSQGTGTDPGEFAQDVTNVMQRLVESAVSALSCLAPGIKAFTGSSFKALQSKVTQNVTKNFINQLSRNKLQTKPTLAHDFVPGPKNSLRRS